MPHLRYDYFQTSGPSGYADSPEEFFEDMAEISRQAQRMIAMEWRVHLSDTTSSGEGYWYFTKESENPEIDRLWVESILGDGFVEDAFTIFDPAMDPRK